MFPRADQNDKYIYTYCTHIIYTWWTAKRSKSVLSTGTVIECGLSVTAHKAHRRRGRFRTNVRAVYYSSCVGTVGRRAADKGNDFLVTENDKYW